ncbi:MAG: hypothetical protein UD936_11530 [Acutalibacteraceae bacterium]|nr:hypothetical protein [Acutalibacteraceae bacterium]
MSTKQLIPILPKAPHISKNNEVGAVGFEDIGPSPSNPELTT